MPNLLTVLLVIACGVSVLAAVAPRSYLRFLDWLRRKPNTEPSPMYVLVTRLSGIAFVVLIVVWAATTLDAG